MNLLKYLFSIFRFAKPFHNIQAATPNNNAKTFVFQQLDNIPKDHIESTNNEKGCLFKEGNNNIVMQALDLASLLK